VAQRYESRSYSGKHHLSSLPLRATWMHRCIPAGQSSGRAQRSEQRPEPSCSIQMPEAQSPSDWHGSPARPAPRAPATQQGTGSETGPTFSQRMVSGQS